MNALEYLASKGLFFGFNQFGQLVTVQDLLTKKLGRVVEYDEAVAYIRLMSKRSKAKKLTAINA
jgi:hypothetical protein